MTTRFSFDDAERAGHYLTHLSGPIAGYSTYYCEHCAAILKIYQDELRLFHAPRGSLSTFGQCVENKQDEEYRPLGLKLRALQMADIERMST